MFFNQTPQRPDAAHYRTRGAKDGVWRDAPALDMALCQTDKYHQSAKYYGGGKKAGFNQGGEGGEQRYGNPERDYHPNYPE